MTLYNEAVARVPMPRRIKALPVSAKGMPVPWFVHWTADSMPDFRVIGRGKVAMAHNRKLCWVCGDPLGRYKAFPVGPMCIVNRTISEPPSHRDCAVFSALACPFLANPRTRRREGDMPEDHRPPAGTGILRNPGAIGVWITEGYRPFRTPDGGTLFTFDDPIELLWFAHGRVATRDEVEASIASGLPLLEAEAAKQGPEACQALAYQARVARRYLPAT